MLPVPIIDIGERPILIFWFNERGEAEGAYQAIKKYDDNLYAFASYVLETFKDWKDKEFYIVPCQEEEFDNIIGNIGLYANRFEVGDLELPEAFTLTGKEFLSEESIY